MWCVLCFLNVCSIDFVGLILSFDLFLVELNLLLLLIFKKINGNEKILIVEMECEFIIVIEFINKILEGMKNFCIVCLGVLYMYIGDGLKY